MLFELPTADEIDSLAITTPRFEVRKFEFDLSGQPADLKYAPCKGQIVLVIAGKGGIVLTRTGKGSEWGLPTGRIVTTEDIVSAAKRIAMEQTGLIVRCLDLAAMYDVVWHYSDITIKRLHIIYAAVTDDEPCLSQVPYEARFFATLPEEISEDEVASTAVGDCSTK